MNRLIRAIAQTAHQASDRLPTTLGVLEYREEGDIIVRARNTEQVQTVLDGASAELDARQEQHARGDDV